MHVSRYRCCQKKGNRGMRKQESSYIRMNACKPTCVWVLVNANACGHTHAGLQACPHSDLPAFLLACRPVCLRACLPAHRQARRQAIRKQAGSNTMWKRYWIKSRTVLLIFISKMRSKCTIMIRCLIFSIFQRNNFGNEGEKHYFCKWEKRSFDWCRTLQNREARWFPNRYLLSWQSL